MGMAERTAGSTSSQVACMAVAPSPWHAPTLPCSPSSALARKPRRSQNPSRRDTATSWKRECRASRAARSHADPRAFPSPEPRAAGLTHKSCSNA